MMMTLINLVARFDTQQPFSLTDISELSEGSRESDTLNNFLLNVSTTKELRVNSGRKQRRNYAPLNFHRSATSLTWMLHTVLQARKTSRDYSTQKQTLHHLHSSTIRIITVWHRNSTEQDCKPLQRVVHSAECTIGGALPV